ncbi:MAG: hypothetical protein JWL63_3468 [Rhodocyclales bacterium]|nr:hypothetical protein [Rhodocyclales bacterium]
MAEQKNKRHALSGISWLRIAVAISLVVFAAYVVAHLEWQEETTRSGINGEARHNPYYAGMLLLTQSGYPAKRLDDAIALDGLAEHSTLLLDSPALFNNRKQAAKLVSWVRRGGHLVLPLSRRSDPDLLLQALGVETLGWNVTSSAQQTISVDDEPLNTDLRNAVVFNVDATMQWAAVLPGYFDQVKGLSADEQADGDADSDKDGVRDGTQLPPRAFHSDRPARARAQEQEEHSVYARWRIGEGTVTAGAFAPFGNATIEDNDHAGLFMRLMTLPMDQRPVFIALTAEYPGLGTWLIQHAGEALIALAVLLAALLWRAMPRFGPLLPGIAPKRPGLLEHLSATGDFLLREKQYEALIAPLREDVAIRLTHLRSRHPEIESLPALGAHIAALDLHEVTLALTPQPADAQDFQRRSRTLATLRRHCSRMQNTFSPEGSRV